MSVVKTAITRFPVRVMTLILTATVILILTMTPILTHKLSSN